MNEILETAEALHLALGHEPAGEQSGEPTHAVLVTADEIELGDLLMGMWVTGITMGQHDGREARTFQLGHPMTPRGQMTIGRLTLINSKDNAVVVVREA